MDITSAAEEGHSLEEVKSGGCQGQINLKALDGADRALAEEFGYKPVRNATRDMLLACPTPVLTYAPGFQARVWLFFSPVLCA